MKLLSIGSPLVYEGLDIHFVSTSEIASIRDTIASYDYMIIHGGDGTIRRTLQALHTCSPLPPIILNPTGSFNVIAKLYRVPTLSSILNALTNQCPLQTQSHPFYRLNSHIFLFSAGNMGDLQHILLSETLRFGWLKEGAIKYLLSLLFLLPLHLILTPFMLMSKSRFFIFTPLSLIQKFGSFYGRVEDTICIEVENYYNMIELDGDVVTIEEATFFIKKAGAITLITGTE